MRGRNGSKLVPQGSDRATLFASSDSFLVRPKYIITDDRQQRDTTSYLNTTITTVG